METTACIYRIDNEWVLQIFTRSAEQSYLTNYSYRKLIDAIEMASVLQMHIDNIKDLPLTQYAVA